LQRNANTEGISQPAGRGRVNRENCYTAKGRIKNAYLGKRESAGTSHDQSKRPGAEQRSRGSDRCKESARMKRVITQGNLEDGGKDPVLKGKGKERAEPGGGKEARLVVCRPEIRTSYVMGGGFEKKRE